MHRSALLLVDILDRSLLPDAPSALPGFDTVHVLEVDYSHPDSAIQALQAAVNRYAVDIVLFSHNDQVFSRHSIGEMIRAVPAGYSTFSGIDTANAYEQAASLLADLRHGNGHIEWPERVAPQLSTRRSMAGTFSLIFDTEQMGGVRYGLPRILPLLDRYGVRATFFVTGFVQDLYPDLLPELMARGHEVGIHGQFHERLAGLSIREQRNRIAAHLANFRAHGSITGANFIYRADARTIRALADNDIDYFVVFAQHVYRPFAYRTLFTHPLPVTQNKRLLWMVPVPVETYTLPPWAIRPLVDAALARARHYGDEHVSILMHPFRDGTEKHAADLERLLHDLVVRRGLRPVTLEAKVGEIAQHARFSHDADLRIFMAMPRVDQSHPEAPTDWWARSELYYERLARVFYDLVARGNMPVLSVEETRGNVAVYPELPDGVAFACCTVDPLSPAQRRNYKYATALDAIEQGARVAFAPAHTTQSNRSRLRLSRPRRWGDLTAFVPEMAVRAAYRLNPGKILF